MYKCLIEIHVLLCVLTIKISVKRKVSHNSPSMQICRQHKVIVI